MTNAVIRPVRDDEVSAEDRAQLVECLKTWQKEGTQNPMIPVDYDVDGDGSVDAFGLGPFGELVYVSGATVRDTVYVSTGGGEETGTEVS